MNLRRRPVHCVWILLALAVGCSNADFSAPLVYEEQPTMTARVEGKADLADKPKIRDRVRGELARLYGPNPKDIHVPEDAPLSKDETGLLGGLLAHAARGAEGVKELPHVGGYAIYRDNCLQCHGLTGAGDGPTAVLVFPPPRDFRRGLFKFTSTTSGAHPVRADIRRSVRDGLASTSMPAFDSILSAEEIEQVVDYVMFLSLRGETELALIAEGSLADEDDPEVLDDEVVQDLVDVVFDKWRDAEEKVVNPPVPPTPSSPESILRGRELFLGRTKEKLECAGCHGRLGKGDGESFVDQDVFNRIVFRGDPTKIDEEVAKLDAPTRELWKRKSDDWGNPLRPADLTLGVYKGGRRPIDIYWRIAKGINGAQMPAHYPAIDHAQIWDLVNFVLALPQRPDLLKDAGPATETAAVGR